jgi:aspartate racemase
MKTIGIIGGFGPETTAAFQLKIIQKMQRANIDQRPPILSWNTPISQSMERNLILQNQGLHQYIPFIQEGARRLRAGGADFLVLPSNTLHALDQHIRQVTDIPFISIIEETMNKIIANKFSRVGLIATSSSLKHRVHIKPLTTAGIEVVLPTKQAKIDCALNNLASSQTGENTKSIIIQALEELKCKGVEATILGCTDIQLLDITHKAPVLDTLDILVESSAKAMLS